MRSKGYYTTRPDHPPSLSVKRKRKRKRKRKQAFKKPPRRNFHFNTTTLYRFDPPGIKSTEPRWITASTTSDSTTTLQFQHPLTLQPQLWNLPTTFDLTIFKPFKLAVSYHTTPHSFEKLLVFPKPVTPHPNYDDHTLILLSNRGLLRGQSPSSATWVSCTGVDLFDDIIIFRGKIYALDRDGYLYLVTVNTIRVAIGKPIIHLPVSNRSGWRKRLVASDCFLYAVVRVEDNLFQVFWTIARGQFPLWSELKKFAHSSYRQTLYISRNYHFFSEAVTEMSDHDNCIVFQEGAFPKYGDDGWEFSQNENDIAVFRVSDGTFARDGDNNEFSKLDWSPPPWILHASLGSSKLCSQSESKPEDNESNREDKKAEEMESDSNSEGKEDEEDGQMQCDLKSPEKEDEEIHCNANIGGDVFLQGEVPSSLFGLESESTDTWTASSSAAKEVTRTILNMNGGNDAAEQGTSWKNITHSVLGACTSSTAKSHKSDSVTSKFEGFDVRSEFIPTLQKIWQKYGNIIENSTMRSGGILATALDSLAIVVQILNGNTAESLSDSQADCLRLTLADLRCICFKVDWLVPFVEKAVKLHKSKPLLESFNNLSQLSSRVKERRVILFDELDKLGEEENRLKEEIAKLSKMIPISGEVKFDEALGLGLI